MAAGCSYDDVANLIHDATQLTPTQRLASIELMVRGNDTNALAHLEALASPDDDATAAQRGSFEGLSIAEQATWLRLRGDMLHARREYARAAAAYGASIALQVPITARTHLRYGQALLNGTTVQEVLEGRQQMDAGALERAVTQFMRAYEVARADRDPNAAAEACLGVALAPPGGQETRIDWLLRALRFTPSDAVLRHCVYAYLVATQPHSAVTQLMASIHQRRQ